MPNAPKKDYAYQSTWKYVFSRDHNLAHQGGIAMKEMIKQYGRFQKKRWMVGTKKN